MQQALQLPDHHSAWIDVNLDALAYNYRYV